MWVGVYTLVFSYFFKFLSFCSFVFSCDWIDILYACLLFISLGVGLEVEGLYLGV